MLPICFSPMNLCTTRIVKRTRGRYLLTSPYINTRQNSHQYFRVLPSHVVTGFFSHTISPTIPMDTTSPKSASFLDTSSAVLLLIFRHISSWARKRPNQTIGQGKTIVRSIHIYRYHTIFFCQVARVGVIMRISFQSHRPSAFYSRPIINRPVGRLYAFNLSL